MPFTIKVQDERETGFLEYSTGSSQSAQKYVERKLKESKASTPLRDSYELVRNAIDHGQAHFMGYSLTLSVYRT